MAEHPHSDLGYRVLTEDEQALVGAIRAEGRGLVVLINLLRADETTDQRWVSIGATHFQEGLMALVRSVTRPDFL